MAVNSPIVPPSTYASSADEAHEHAWGRAWGSAAERIHFSTHGPVPSGTASRPTLPEPLAMPARLAVLTEAGGEVAGVDIHFDQRAIVGSVVSLTGSDASGLLTIRLGIRPNNTSHSINLTFDPGEGTTPRELLPVARFLDALRPRHRLTFWVKGHEAHVPDSAPIPENVEAFGENLLPLIEMLARTQKRLGYEFPMPGDPTAEEIGEIIHIDRLLRGETLHGSWTEGALEVDRDGLEELEAELLGTEPFPVDLTVKLNWEFRGETLVVGEVRELVKSARAANPESVRELLRDGGTGPVTVQLVPGVSSEVERSLLDASSSSPFGRDDTVVSISATSYQRLQQRQASAGSSG